jgi:hypothetical protein
MAFKEAKPHHANPLALGHHAITQGVEFVEAMPLEGIGPAISLCALVQVHSDVPPGPGMHQGATTLAIHMDQAAAISLVQQIYETGRKMGWRLPPLAETPASSR